MSRTSHHKPTAHQDEKAVALSYLYEARRRGLAILPCALASGSVAVTLDGRSITAGDDAFIEEAAGPVNRFFDRIYQRPTDPRDGVALHLVRLRDVGARGAARSARKVFRAGVDAAMREHGFASRTAAAFWGIETLLNSMLAENNDG